jgi:TRAP-type C4-dicarboxylate transport system permease small subunit
MNLLTRLTSLANTGVVAVGALAFGTLPVIVVYDVIARYIFNAPSIWVNEIAVYLVQAIVFLPLGLLVTDNSHIRVTLLTDRLSPWVQVRLHRFSLVMTAVFATFIVWLGWAYTAHAWKQGQLSPTLLAVPLWIPNALIPLGGLLLLVSALGALLASPPAPAKSH